VYEERLEIMFPITSKVQEGELFSSAVEFGCRVFVLFLSIFLIRFLARELYEAGMLTDF